MRAVFLTSVSKIPPKNLFVGERVDGVFLRRLVGGVKRTQHGADGSNHGGTKDPAPGYDDGNGRNAVMNGSARGQTNNYSGDDSAQREQQGFAQDDIDDVELRCAERF